jgi:dTDP-4-dehydrorhamnose reductase
MSMKNSIVFGNGWLGKKIANEFGGELCDIDILDTYKVKSIVAETQPDVVINCAGKCGNPNIDWCEKNEENRRLTTYVNGCGPAILLDACRSVGDAFFVHLSSGCLWDVPESHNEITEEDFPNPVSHYSETKVLGEMNLRGKRDVLIVRLRMPLDDHPHPRNLIDKLSGFDKVIDTPNSVTYVPTLTSAIEHLVEQRRTGIYNVCDGVTSAAELMKMYRDYVDKDHKFEVVSAEELYSIGLVKAGRSNCRLSTRKLEQTGFKLPSFERTLRGMFQRYGESGNLTSMKIDGAKSIISNDCTMWDYIS